MKTWIVLAALAIAAAVASAQSKVQANVPANWSRAQDGDTEIYTPTAEPAGTAQMLLLAPKPAAADFYQQFDSERTQLEQYWGLRAPAPLDPQRGTSRDGPWAAYFASYDSDGGPRYMSFLARRLGSQFVMVVFVAATDDAFNRLAPQVVDSFKGLALRP